MNAVYVVGHVAAAVRGCGIPCGESLVLSQYATFGVTNAFAANAVEDWRMVVARVAHSAVVEPQLIHGAVVMSVPTMKKRSVGSMWNG